MLAILLSTIPFFDFLLTKIIGKKARWFQLHAIINIVICILIGKQTMNLLLSPSLPLLEYSKNDIMALQLVLGLHSYHIFIERLTLIEWWHHICFVAFGVLPVLFLYNNQITSLYLFAGCGLPGAIEYTLLSMVKNNKITSLQQKNINSWINNYIRCPISLYAASLAHINSTNTGNYNLLDLYIIFLVFFNGTFFNKMAIENHMWHRCSIQN
jgi:hypothetical protein